MTQPHQEEKIVDSHDPKTCRRPKTAPESSNRTLYPPRTLLQNGTLVLEDSLHCLYYEVYGPSSSNTTVGNDDPSKMGGKIALSLHGGPGAGCFPKHAQFFDPEKYHKVILFDQRGCGRSTPRGETRLNTLQLLVQDIETLREHLDVDAFDVVLGGSWGSTLALAYAQSFPMRVRSMVLRGVCLFRSREIDWLFGNSGSGTGSGTDTGSGTGTGTGTGTGNSNGNDTIHYDKTFCISNKKELACEWKKFVNGVSKNDIDHDKNDIDDDNNEANHDNERDGTSTRRVLYKYYNALLGPDPLARAKAARSWFQWEMSVASLSIELDVKNGELGDVIVWNGARRVWVVKQGNDDQVVGTQKYHNKYLDFLRKWPKLSSDTMMLDSPCRPTGIQPLISQQPVRCEDGNDKSHSDAKETTAAETFIPAQAMLTCFYSVNQEFIMENFDLLKNENIERIRHIPCIAVQGAKDMICPPDSALDLVEAWPEMECRFVTEGKHSMYDPRIMSELIEATDDVACRLSSVQHLRTVN